MNDCTIKIRMPCCGSLNYNHWGYNLTMPLKKKKAMETNDNKSNMPKDVKQLF